MSHFLGTTEHMILLAIVRLGADAYGAAILEELESTTGRAPSSGSVSTVLDRLETKGFLTSEYRAGGERRGGRPRRVVSLTEAGRAALVETQRAFRSVMAGLDLGLEPETP